MEHLKVLIVDDHREFRGVLKEFLETEGNIGVVGEAADGREAVKLARELHPELVLMDISMPRMDGFSATRAIKSEFPDIVIAFVSFYEDDNYRTSAREAGGDAFISKWNLASELPLFLQSLREGKKVQKTGVPERRHSGYSAGDRFHQ